jgi:GLPGLI family protein
MTRRLAFALILMLPCALSAQEGTVAYSHSVKLDFELPPELRARLEARGGGAGMFATERVSDFVLLFNASESLMKPVPPAPEEARPAAAADRRHPGMMARMRMSSASRRDRESIVEAYVRYEDGSIVESREFLGRTFLIEDERPDLRWKITGEQAEFLGYVVQKATADVDSSSVEAWFTQEIPIPAGPAMYGGLPGMILVVSLDGGQEQYSATAVSLTAVAEGVIVRPREGERVSRERYEEIVAEKLEELRTVGGGR